MQATAHCPRYRNLLPMIRLLTTTAFSFLLAYTGRGSDSAAPELQACISSLRGYQGTMRFVRHSEFRLVWKPTLESRSRISWPDLGVVQAPVDIPHEHVHCRVVPALAHLQDVVKAGATTTAGAHHTSRVTSQKPRGTGPEVRPMMHIHG